MLGGPPPQRGRREKRRRTRHQPAPTEAFPEIDPNVDPFADGPGMRTIDPGSEPPFIDYGDQKPQAPPAEPPPPITDLDGAVAAVCACIKACCDALPKRIAHEVEQLLVTSRGVPVRPAPTCMQPVRSTDVDDQVLAFDLPGADANGVERLVLRRRAAKSVVIKGLNWEFAVAASIRSPADPGDQLVVHVLVNGTQIGGELQGDDLPTGGLRTRSAYHTASRPPAPGGIDNLAASTIYLQEGDVIDLVAVRIQQPTGQVRIGYAISARWKGWEWDPTVHADGITGVQGQ